jgi:hypothetical protein
MNRVHAIPNGILSRLTAVTPQFFAPGRWAETGTAGASSGAVFSVVPRGHGPGCSNTKGDAARFLGALLDRLGGISILMFSFRRSFLTLAFAVSASLASQSPALLAQASSSSQPDAPAAAATPPAAQAPNHGQLTVAARIKARREQRRATAIKEIYTHLYDAEIGMGYLRFHPGPNLQRLNEYTNGTLASAGISMSAWASLSTAAAPMGRRLSGRTRTATPRSSSQPSASTWA